MPNYDYLCLNENKRFEVFHKMDAKTLDKCPDCGGKVEKILTTGGLVSGGKTSKPSNFSCPMGSPCSNGSCQNLF